MARKNPPMQKSMTHGELRTLLAQKEAALQQCLEYNRQWKEVAEGLERQKAELIQIVQNQQVELEHWKKMAMGFVQ